MMPILSFWRVYRTKAECVWAGSVPDEPIGYPGIVDEVLSQHILIPKKFAGAVARHLPDTPAKILEAYPHSYSHAAQPELGVGLALDNPGKWTKEWPRFQWDVLEDITNFGTKCHTCQQKWSVEQLAAQRRKKAKMPHGLDPRVWEMLGAVRK